MKKYWILILCFSLTFCHSALANYNLSLTERNEEILQAIDDGWYSATVRYSNYSTGTYATYTLEVKVVRNQVVAIQFGNGGSVHTGFNNSGYIYSGGYLRFEKNYNGDIIAASTTVQISDSDGIKSFDIRIE